MLAREALLRLGCARNAEVWLGAAAAAIAALTCVPALLSMSVVWQASEFYGHGYAIPAVAAYLAFARRREIAATLRELDPPAIGPLVIFGAAAFQVVMVMGDVRFAAGIGIPVLLGAAAYAIAGFALLRTLALPLVFLLLMVPPPSLLLYGILFRLKLLVTGISISLLQAAGVTVYADGNQIFLPHHTLFVADACSGLTSIVTLMPLACIVAYFLSRGVWRRLVVIGSVVPLAMAANIVRVLVTVRVVSSHGLEFSQGILHESFGVTTYVVGLLFVIGVARVLR